MGKFCFTFNKIEEIINKSVKERNQIKDLGALKKVQYVHLFSILKGSHKGIQ